jgi:hypothetical protein
VLLTLEKEQLDKFKEKKFPKNFRIELRCPDPADAFKR